MKAIQVKIANLLQGAAVGVHGDSTGTLECAAAVTREIDINHVHDDDVWFFNALLHSVNTKVPLDAQVLTAFLDEKLVPDQDKLILRRRFNEVTKQKADTQKFAVMLNHIKYEVSKQTTNYYIWAATAAMDSGFKDPVTRIQYDGVEGARELLSKAITLGQQVGSDRFPSGNVFDEEDDILQAYQKVRDADPDDVPNGIKSGYTSIDSTTLRFGYGELILIGAATGEGKSMMCVNMAWDAACKQGKNVVIVTAETLRSQYRRRLLARHSCSFPATRPDGLLLNSIKAGSFSPEDEDNFKQMVRHFTTYPEHGYLNIMQVTRGATIADISRELNAVNAKIPIDVVFIDYLSLIGPPRRLNKRQAEVTETIQAAKELAVTFDAGRGLVVVSAHQMGIDARERVKPVEGKFYTIRDFSDTSEAGKSADIAIALLRTDEFKAQKQVCCGFLKNRDGEIPPLITLQENYASACLVDSVAVGDTLT